MPRYEYDCPDCGEREIITKRMSEAGKDEVCAVCGASMDRVFTTGMIKVVGGSSPTRIGKRYGTTKRSEDPGFEKEFQSIYESDPIKDPNTGDEYQITETQEGERVAMTKKQEKDRKDLIDRQIDYAEKGLTKEFIAKTKGDTK